MWFFVIWGAYNIPYTGMKFFTHMHLRSFLQPTPVFFFFVFGGAIIDTFSVCPFHLSPPPPFLLLLLLLLFFFSSAILFIFIFIFQIFFF